MIIAHQVIELANIYNPRNREVLTSSLLREKGKALPLRVDNDALSRSLLAITAPSAPKPVTDFVINLMHECKVSTRTNTLITRTLDMSIDDKNSLLELSKLSALEHVVTSPSRLRRLSAVAPDGSKEGDEIGAWIDRWGNTLAVSLAKNRSDDEDTRNRIDMLDIIAPLRGDKKVLEFLGRKSGRKMNMTLLQHMRNMENKVLRESVDQKTEYMLEFIRMAEDRASEIKKQSGYIM